MVIKDTILKYIQGKVTLLRPSTHEQPSNKFSIQLKMNLASKQSCFSMNYTSFLLQTVNLRCVKTKPSMCDPIHSVLVRSINDRNADQTGQMFDIFIIYTTITEQVVSGCSLLHISFTTVIFNIPII